MKRLIQSALAALGLGPRPSNSVILTPAQFTNEYAEVMRKSAPGCKIEIVKDTELKVTTAEGAESTAFLDNAYAVYSQNPKSKNDIIKSFISAGLETITTEKQELDRTRIIPVIKDRGWIDEMRNALISRGAKKLPENVYEELNPELIILYAEDSPKNIRYITPEDLENANLGRAELRNLACANLRRLLPKIERHGANGLYMMTAGGDYEAGLLLFDSMWTNFQKEVAGDVVVAIPTRDLLIVTGSEDSQGLEKMRQMVQKSYAEGSYRLTQKLFVFRDGTFIEFSN